jgi:hypothetical protein
MVPLRQLAVSARQLLRRVRRPRAKYGIRRGKRIASARRLRARTCPAPTAKHHALVYLIADHGAENSAPDAAAHDSAEDGAYRYPLPEHGDASQLKNAL